MSSVTPHPPNYMVVVTFVVVAVVVVVMVVVMHVEVHTEFILATDYLSLNHNLRQNCE